MSDNDITPRQRLRAKLFSTALSHLIEQCDVMLNRTKAEQEYATLADVRSKLPSDPFAEDALDNLDDALLLMIEARNAYCEDLDYTPPMGREPYYVSPMPSTQEDEN